MDLHFRSGRATALGAVLIAASVFSSGSAAALNYERNDVRGRELAFAMMRTPVEGLPVTLGLRGSARRHIRHVYYGTSAWLGWALNNRPVLMLSGSIGLESAANAFEPYRSYGELGIGTFWAATDEWLRKLMTFHAEVGIRWTVRDWNRPHWQAFAGLRTFANFRFVGVAAVTGINFTFD
jgi:hypothetical protein